MRVIRRSTSALLVGAMLVLVPTISPGGPPPPGHKGPFDIDPRTEKANEDFDLSVDKGDGDGCIIVPPFSSDGDVPDAILLGVQLASVRVQVVDTEGNAGPANTVLDSEFYTPDLSGDWGSPPTIPLNLPVGTYLVTAECREFNGTAPGGAGDAESTSSSSQPQFVLLGNGEEPACTEVSGEQREDDAAGCYVPQELVIVAPAAEPRQEEPTFTG